MGRLDLERGESLAFDESGMGCGDSNLGYSRHLFKCKVPSIPLTIPREYRKCSLARQSKSTTFLERSSLSSLNALLRFMTIRITLADLNQTKFKTSYTSINEVILGVENAIDSRPQPKTYFRCGGCESRTVRYRLH